MSFNKFEEAEKEKKLEQERKQTEYIDNKLEEFLEDQDLTVEEVREDEDIDVRVLPTKDYAKIVLFRKDDEEDIEKPEFLEEKSSIIKPNE